MASEELVDLIALMLEGARAAKKKAQDEDDEVDADQTYDRLADWEKAAVQACSLMSTMRSNRRRQVKRSSGHTTRLLKYVSEGHYCGRSRDDCLERRRSGHDFASGIRALSPNSKEDGQRR